MDRAQTVASAVVGGDGSQVPALLPEAEVLELVFYSLAAPNLFRSLLIAFNARSRSTE